VHQVGCGGAEARTWHAGGGGQNSAHIMFQSVMVVWIARAALAWVCMVCQVDGLQHETLDEDP